MEHTLGGMTVAILVADGFEQVEMTAPREALIEAGASCKIVSYRPGKVQGFNQDAAGDEFDIDVTLDAADPMEFDAVLLPGGAKNAERLRDIPEAQHFVREIQEQQKPVAAICHAAWLLVSAGMVGGRTLTSYPTLESDVRKAGGNWIDQEVVVDGNLVTSRTPDDIPAFNAKLLDALTQRLLSNLRGTGEVGVSSVGVGS